MKKDWSIDEVLNWKNIPLPGVMAQDLMLPHPSRNKFSLPETYKKAGIMILIFRHQNEWNFTLIKRSKHPKDKHSGQISLPGGQLDIIDNNNLEDCAIRETHEEIGIIPTSISIIAPLTSIYVPVSNFMIYPYVGLFNGDISQFSIQENEVDELIVISINDFLLDTTKQKTDIKLKSHTLKSVPVFNIKDHIVWGATAMVLSEFKQWIL